MSVCVCMCLRLTFSCSDQYLTPQMSAIGIHFLFFHRIPGEKYTLGKTIENSDDAILHAESFFLQKKKIIPSFVVALPSPSPSVSFYLSLPLTVAVG